MEKFVYVTEGGRIDESGYFCGSGVIGLDREPKYAISYPIRSGFYRFRSTKYSARVMIVYTLPDSKEAIKITKIELF